MTDDVLVAALGLAADLLDTDERTWVVGAVHLADLPLDTPALSDEKVRSVLEIATTTVEFPSGPISYLGPEYELDLHSNHRLVRIHGGEHAPHLEMQIGFGVSGFVALALTRSDVFDDGSVHEGGIPLADLESVIADTYVLAIGAGLAQAYTGRLEFAFNTFDSRPGVTPVAYTIDEDTGGLVPALLQDGFVLTRGSTVVDETMTPRSAHTDIHRMAEVATRRFGVAPQLTSLLDDSNEAYSSNPLLYQDSKALTVWGP